jgi:hypothetical protein
MSKGILMCIMMSLAMSMVVVVSTNNTVHLVFADKNPQAECINSQNEQFIGKEQSGDAYKHSKDTCQSLN